MRDALANFFMESLRTRVSALVFAAMVCFHAAHAQDTKDPIDKALDACLAGPSGNNTAGQLDCAQKATASWDGELNTAYQKLMKSLDPASQALLRNSQRQWLAFRDAEKKFDAGPWSAKGGTMAGVNIAMINTDIVRSRVLALRNYLGGGNPA